MLALAVVETVGSFTGVDPRFTALVGAVGGLLVVHAPARPAPGLAAQQRLGALAHRAGIVPRRGQLARGAPLGRARAGSAR